MSPTLASIYLNDLLDILNENGEDLPSVLAYADDLVLIASSEVDLRNRINITQNWCEEWCLEINMDKT